MNIQSTLQHRTALRPSSSTTKQSCSHDATPEPSDSFQSTASVQGPLGRAVYGAALYGIPAIAGATMGINGVVPGALIGAGIGGATHLEDGRQAAIFAATGAVVGACGGYLGFLGASYGFKIPSVLIAAAVGAGTQALYSLTNER